MNEGLVEDHQLHTFLDLPKSVRKYRTFIVPAGIGDFAWIYAKLVNLDEPFNIGVADEGRRHPVAMRSLPYFQLLPNVAYATLAGVHSGEIVKYARRWNGRQLPITDPALLCFNLLLEAGTPLPQILPDLPTTWHYPIFRPDWAELEADIIIPKGQKTVAIFTSNDDYFKATYDEQGKPIKDAHAETLPPERWALLLDYLQKRLPDHRILLIGAAWDGQYMKTIRELCWYRGFTVDVVDDRHIAVSLAILRRCRFFIAAASGLGIIAEYERVPTMHLYPPTLIKQVRYPGTKHERVLDVKLMGSWESPEMVAAGKSISIPFDYPQQLVPDIEALIENTND